MNKLEFFGFLYSFKIREDIFVVDIVKFVFDLSIFFVVFWDYGLVDLRYYNRYWRIFFFYMLIRGWEFLVNVANFVEKRIGFEILEFFILIFYKGVL